MSWFWFSFQKLWEVKSEEGKRLLNSFHKQLTEYVRMFDSVGGWHSGEWSLCIEIDFKQLSSVAQELHVVDSFSRGYHHQRGTGKALFYSQKCNKVPEGQRLSSVSILCVTLINRNHFFHGVKDTCEWSKTQHFSTQ